jgi:hypothetical protein
MYLAVYLGLLYRRPDPGQGASFLPHLLGCSENYVRLPGGCVREVIFQQLSRLATGVQTKFFQGFPGPLDCLVFVQETCINLKARRVGSGSSHVPPFLSNQNPIETSG